MVSTILTLDYEDGDLIVEISGLKESLAAAVIVLDRQGHFLACNVGNTLYPEAANQAHEAISFNRDTPEISPQNGRAVVVRINEKPVGAIGVNSGNPIDDLKLATELRDKFLEHQDKNRRPIRNI